MAHIALGQELGQLRHRSFGATGRDRLVGSRAAEARTLRPGPSKTPPGELDAVPKVDDSDEHDD
jgi:hypothetical protein